MNQLEPGTVRRMMEESKTRRQQANTYEGSMEILYESLADGDITMDQFNLFSAIENKKWNK
ncbi:hypothetical protein MUK70_11575 [Dyadobacter chenwenxiniae]|uniref:Uncharacterized protein n=1 Tax=Dyadobacter chenwenxiniae TaxID=2906456 RepID=A0A9X1PHC0_9BACT|nr:hypothetical protein [Dyadobacter chenwenxiniae]MCF0059879.1 hypothetical protein [Dyadobacter chenwenxiniae]UON85619.1 hypothetical protein MUK70_11575 [Dyadobacter chenwenxiniae]